MENLCIENEEYVIGKKVILIDEKFIISIWNKEKFERLWLMITRSNGKFLKIEEIDNSSLDHLDLVSTISLGRNKMWYIGGQDKKKNYSKNIVAYDCMSNTWKQEKNKIEHSRLQNVCVIPTAETCTIIGSGRHFEQINLAADCCLSHENHSTECCKLEGEIHSFGFRKRSRNCELYIWLSENKKKKLTYIRNHWSSEDMNLIIASETPKNFESAIVYGYIFSILNEKELWCCQIKNPEWKKKFDLFPVPKEDSIIFLLKLSDVKISVIYEGMDNRVNCSFYCVNLKDKELTLDGGFAFSCDNGFKLSTALCLVEEKENEHKKEKEKEKKKEKKHGDLICTLKMEKYRNQNEEYKNQYRVTFEEDTDFEFGKIWSAISITEEAHYGDHINILRENFPSNGSSRPCFHDAWYLSLKQVLKANNYWKLVGQWGDGKHIYYNEMSRSFVIIIMGLLKGLLSLLKYESWQQSWLDNFDESQIVFGENDINYECPKLMECCIKPSKSKIPCKNFTALAKLIEDDVARRKVNKCSPAVESLILCLKGQCGWQRRFQSNDNLNELLLHPLFLGNERKVDYLFRVRDAFRNTANLTSPYIDVKDLFLDHSNRKSNWLPIVQRGPLSPKYIKDSLVYHDYNYQHTSQLVVFFRNAFMHANDDPNEPYHSRDKLGEQLEKFCPKLLPLIFQRYGSFKTEADI